jgi:hypothetical protein
MENFMFNAGLLNSNPVASGSFGQFGQPAGVGPMMAAYGGIGQGLAGSGFGPSQFGWQNQPGQSVQAVNAIEDVADDIAERIADDIVDQAATGASALFQTQVPYAASQSVGGLNVKRWMNSTRVTDNLRDQIKLHTQQLCRQVVTQLLNVIQSQWTTNGQHTPGVGLAAHGLGAHGLGAHGLGAPGLAAYGAQPFGQQAFGQQTFGQQNIAQLAPVVAGILGMLQSQGQGQAQSPFAPGPYGRVM